MEYYKVLALIFICLFVILAVIIKGFDWLDNDDDIYGGGIHP